MKAAVFLGPNRPLNIEERPVPIPAAGQAVISVARCGICTSDLHMTSGHGAVTLPAGSLLGHEYAGEVVETGPGVNRLRIGDRVTAMPVSACGTCADCLSGSPISCPKVQSMAGGYAEYTLVNERDAIKLPQSLSLADGALVEPLASALHGVLCAGPLAGCRVAVLGMGPIGLGVVYWAKRYGALRILAVSRSARHADLARSMGASECLAIDSDLGGRALAALGGPASVVFECVGAAGMLSCAIELVGSRGKVVSLGMCTLTDSITPFAAGMKSVSLHFSAAYAYRDFQEATETLDSGALEPRMMITDTVGLDRLPARFEELRHPSPHCKVMVSPWTSPAARGARRDAAIAYDVVAY